MGFISLKNKAKELASKVKEAKELIPDNIKEKATNATSTVSGNLNKVFKKDKVQSNSNDEAMREFDKLKNNANDNDLTRVNKNIGNMNKGELKKIWDQVISLWEMTKDPTAQWESKAVAIGALIYTISPVDAIPDVVPILGLTDDAGVIAAAVAILGQALKKYAQEQNQNSIDVNEGPSLSNDMESLKAIISVYSQAAYADGVLTDEEEKHCFELIDNYIFSENGLFPQEKIDKMDIKKKGINKIIADTFDNSMSLNKISKYAIENEQEELFYFYAYSIISIDGNIGDSEAQFLEQFSIMLEITKFDKNKIERNFVKLIA